MKDQQPVVAPKLRVVVMADTDQPAASKMTHKLLHQLGLDVTSADNSDAAVKSSGERSTDLLLLDLPDAADQQRIVEELIALPPASRPRHVAIMSETINDDLIAMRREMNQTRLHLFVKPFHLHGLLGVVRKMESNVLQGVH